MALCFPRSRTAAFSATRPTTWLSASIIYHLRFTSSALALKVFIGSRELSHAAQGVSKVFEVIFLYNCRLSIVAAAERGGHCGPARRKPGFRFPPQTHRTG